MNDLFFSWLALKAHRMWWKMYLGRFTFSLVIKKCKNTLCSNESWSTPPPLGRKHSCISFWSTLCSFSISSYFPFLFPLNKVLITIGFQELIFFRSHWKDPSAFLLHALAITYAVMVTGIPIMLERISVLVNYFNPNSSIVFPSRLGSIRTIWSTSACAAYLSKISALTQKYHTKFS